MTREQQTVIQGLGQAVQGSGGSYVASDLGSGFNPAVLFEATWRTGTRLERAAKTEAVVVQRTVVFADGSRL